MRDVTDSNADGIQFKLLISLGTDLFTYEEWFFQNCNMQMRFLSNADADASALASILALASIFVFIGMILV